MFRDLIQQVRDLFTAYGPRSAVLVIVSLTITGLIVLLVLNRLGILNGLLF